MRKPAPVVCRLCKQEILELPYILVIYNNAVGNFYFHAACWMGPIPQLSSQIFTKYTVCTVKDGKAIG